MKIKALVAPLVAFWCVVVPARATVPDEALQADVLILGEIHDSAAHHRLQAEVLRRMVDAGRRPTVVMEMIPADRQQALDRHVATARDDVDGLSGVLAWEKRGWGDFALYRPIFEAVLAAGLPLRAGDLSDPEKALAAGSAPLPDERHRELGLHLPLPQAAAEDLKAVLRASHCDMIPEAALERMVTVQRARDGSMARAVIEASASGPVVLIAGEGHARKDWGVPRLLAALAPDLSVVSIALSGSDAGGPFDLIVDAGRPPPADDPCAAFRRD